MYNAMVKLVKTDATVYEGDFATQQEITNWSAIRFPNQERVFQANEAPEYDPEDLLEEFTDNEIDFVRLKPLYSIEITDVSSQYAAQAAKDARKEAGKIARLKCQDALDIIAGWNLERELTAQQITDMQAAFSTILLTLQANRPDSAKALIQAVEPDETLITEEMKEEILSVL
jgi:hypothetical protein